jgi:hypothetical protein
VAERERECVCVCVGVCVCERERERERERKRGSVQGGKDERDGYVCGCLYVCGQL